MGVHQPDNMYVQVKDLFSIPRDEPIFILRAQDQASKSTLEYYLDENADDGNDPTWMQDVQDVIDQFDDWQVRNSALVKRAD